MKAARQWLLPKSRAVNRTAWLYVCVSERKRVCVWELFEQACVNWGLMNITLLTLRCSSPHCSFSFFSVSGTNKQAHCSTAAEQSVSHTATDGIQSHSSWRWYSFVTQCFKINRGFVVKPWNQRASSQRIACNAPRRRNNYQALYWGCIKVKQEEPNENVL